MSRPECDQRSIDPGLKEFLLRRSTAAGEPKLCREKPQQYRIRRFRRTESIGSLPGRIAEPLFLQELSDQIQTLKMPGKRVILSLPFPIFDKCIPDLEISNAVLQRYGFVETPAENTPASAPARLASLAESPGVEVFDPRKSRCSGQPRTTQLRGVSIYKNQSLAASQTGILQQNLESTLRRITPIKPDPLQPSKTSVQ